MTTNLWWIRRDLRLSDNPALETAISEGDAVIPIFILDEKLLQSKFVGEKRLGFLFAGLRELDFQLKERGSFLVIRKGEPAKVLAELMQESGAAAIYAEPDVSPYATRRDRELEKIFDIRWIGSPAVLPPGVVLKPDGSPYTVFTPFSKAWKAFYSMPGNDLFLSPETIQTPQSLNATDTISLLNLPNDVPFKAGEHAAQAMLNNFIGNREDNEDESYGGIYRYELTRNRMDLEGTARISPYLRFGMLSARQAVLRAHQAVSKAPGSEERKSAEVWLNELIWREFYLHILYHFPVVMHGNFRPLEIRWMNDRAHFEAWKAGKTGYPVVDAGMRQLAKTGWMHNRARMIAASFLTKDLLIDWTWGEQWFMQNLIDGDPSANNGGWQWTAGTGTDAAPYFRIFNPTLQGMKHDPYGRYIRRWLPELEFVPDEYIHEPWKMPVSVQESCGVFIGQQYPAPLIDHTAARERALRAYRA